ncbi:MAG: ribonuclease Z [Clostridia bacterium]|nr:ribonuclease Z [Clostridia bacterium]
MKVVFFGSSHGVPEPNRNCSCALLEVGGKRYFIDMGMDPVPELIRRGMTPGDITAVFITHSHGDHTNGLVPFTDICSWYYKQADPLVFLPEMQIVDALRDWIRLTCNGLRESLRFEKVEEGKLYDDGTISVTAMRTNHKDNAYAYMIEAEGKTLLFTGDLKGGDGPTADYARFATRDGIDLVVAECAHFDPLLYMEPLKKHPPKLFCINHYSWKWAEKCYHLKSLIEPDIPTVLATDGLEIRL